MTDNKVEQSHYQQFNNPNGQQNYQHPYNQQVGVNQPGTQVGYYNSNVNTLQQPYNAGIPGSVNPDQNSKEQYNGFYYVLFILLIFLVFRLIYGFNVLVSVILNIPAPYLYVLVSLLVLLVNALVVNYAKKMMRGFENDDAKPIRGGKPVMIGLSVLILISEILTIVLGLYFVGFFGLPVLLVSAICTEILLAYIIAKCDQVALLLEGISSLHTGLQI